MPTDDVELIKKHYGDFTGLYDPVQAVAHVKVLLTEVLDLRTLFDLQWTRSREADELWRQEDPVVRANVHPDLGVLLAWLMAQIEEHRDRANLLETEIGHLAPVAMTAAADRERANEAARLSAAARDENENILKQVEAMREQVEIVEESRSDLIVDLDRAEQKIKNLAAERGEHRDRAEAANNLHANAERLLAEARAELATMTEVARSNKRVTASFAQEVERLTAEADQVAAERDAAVGEAFVLSNSEALESVRLRGALMRLRGQVVTLLGLCDGLKRFPGYEPANAWVMVHEIERIFEGFKRDASAQDGRDGAPVDAALDGDRPTLPCCDFHNTNCEPPSELCCEHCTEVRHPEHGPGVVCVLDAAGDAAEVGERPDAV